MDKLKCEHRYITSLGKGWECATCGVGVLSLTCPIPLDTLAETLRVLSQPDVLKGEAQNGS